MASARDRMRSNSRAVRLKLSCLSRGSDFVGRAIVFLQGRAHASQVEVPFIMALDEKPFA